MLKYNIFYFQKTKHAAKVTLETQGHSMTEQLERPQKTFMQEG